MIKYGVYPFLIILTFVVFEFLNQWMHSEIALLVTLFSIASIMLVLEILNPFRKDWVFQFKDLVKDSLFIIFVQQLLPKSLVFLVMFYLLGSNLNNSTIWPQQHPIFVQVLLMMLIAEFYQYWMHRFMHHSAFIWPLHEVHHSAKILYSLNTAMFHPLDKLLHIIGDTFLFLLLGVSPEVFIYYYLFYAVNGFFQHCNLDIRLGIFNYLISGPQLHRYHHLINAKQANCNFGNNLIIFDILFKTFYFPKGNMNQEIGIEKPQYPTTFVKLLIQPFSKNKPLAKNR